MNKKELEEKIIANYQGEEKMMAFVLGVMAASNCAAVTLKSFSNEPFIITGVPSAKRTSAS